MTERSGIATLSWRSGPSFHDCGTDAEWQPPAPWNVRGDFLYPSAEKTARPVAYRIKDGVMVTGVRSPNDLAVVAAWAANR